MASDLVHFTFVATQVIGQIIYYNAVSSLPLRYYLKTNGFPAQIQDSFYFSRCAFLQSLCHHFVTTVPRLWFPCIYNYYELNGDGWFYWLVGTRACL